MNRRDELRKQWAEWEDVVKEKRPKDVVFEIKNPFEDIFVFYDVGKDSFTITIRDDDEHVTGSVVLSGYNAEKVYHFLAGLYG
jgi:hypothetical protein